MSEEGDDIVIWVWLKKFVGLDDKGGDQTRKETSLFGKEREREGKVMS